MTNLATLIYFYLFIIMMYIDEKEIVEGLAK